MGNAKRYYFTSPTDAKFEKSIIEYRCSTGVCPDDWPCGRFEEQAVNDIKSEQAIDELE